MVPLPGMGAIIRIPSAAKLRAISSSRLGGIYDLIEVEDNKLLNQRFKSYFSLFINIILLGSVLLLGILMVKKR